MSHPALLVIEAARIQSFLTAGGRLRDLAGGSVLVESLGGNLLDGALQDCGLQKIEVPDLSGPPQAGEFVLLRESGGSVQGIAPSVEKSKELVSRLSLAVLELLPGLSLLASVAEITEWDKVAFDKAWDDSLKQRSIQKQAARGRIQFAPPFLARCESTGEPATGHDNKGARLADNPLLLREGADDANTRLRAIFKEEAGEWEFPLDVDELAGDQGGYLAVIHLDGNDIGRLLRKSADSPNAAGTLQDRLGKRRRSSEGLARLSENPARDIVGHFVALIQDGEMRAPDGRWSLKLKDKKLPFRPLVMGGDDLTLVCEGRIAFPLALKLLEAFEERSREVEDLGGDMIHACAGVAVVKKHYPFAKAYELAEDLTKLAKTKAREMPGSYIDFEVVTATQHTAQDVARDQPGVGRTKGSTLKLTRKPYSLEEFKELLDDAWRVHTRLPGRQVRAIADAAIESKEAADAALKHLNSQLSRGLTGLKNPLSEDDLKSLIHGDSIFDESSTRWHDLIEVSRFFTRPEQDEDARPATADAIAGGEQ